MNRQSGEEDGPAPTLPRIEPVPEGAERLIGYEPRTVEFDPQDPAEAREFLTAYREALAHGGRVLPVRGRRGKLAVWQEAVQFWREPEVPSDP